MIVFRLDGDISAPGAARAAVRHALSRRSAALCDVAVLLADEIVTNALVHAGGEIEVKLEDSHDSIRVEVSDSSPAAPLLGSPKPQDERGRGLLIVDSLASSWGVVQRAGGKSVWFQLDVGDD